MAIRMRIADNANRIFTEIKGARIENVAWRLNEIDVMTFTLAKTSQYVNERNLHVGNRVFLEFDNGLPAWAGIIYLPREWDGGRVSVNCFGIEHKLDRILTRRIHAFRGFDVGFMIQDLLRHANTRDSLNIIIGQIWHGGLFYERVFNYQPIWTVIANDLLPLEGADIYFQPYITSDEIYWRATVREDFGNDLTETVGGLYEGKNLESNPTLSEQGEVVTRVLSIGGGTTWGYDRPIVSYENLTASARYGLHEKRKIYSGIHTPEALRGLAYQILQKQSQPIDVLSLRASDSPPATFEQYNIGDSITVTLPSYHFDGYQATARIVGRQYIPADGVCEIVATSVKDVDDHMYQQEILKDYIEEEGA